MNENTQPFSGRLVVSVAMLSLGLLWTADNLGLTDAGAVLRWWPLLLVAFGISRLAGWGGERRVLVGALCTVMGALMLGNELGWVRAGLGLIWPLALVALGVEILMRGSRAPLGGGSDAVADGGDYVRSFALMGSAVTRSTSQALRGAELSAIMGGVELDLREARPADGRAVVDVFAFMGGIDIAVPPDWHVEFHATPLMGGLQDVRSLDASDKAGGTLVVRGMVMLGGLQVGDEPTGRTVRVGVGRRSRREWREWREQGEVRVRAGGVQVNVSRGDGRREVQVEPAPPEAGATPPPPPTEPR